MVHVILLAFLMCGGAWAQQPAAPSDSPRLLRSLSGPSGKVVGPQFVLDEVRNRFVYPQDQALVVYGEWDAAPGDHALTAIWKGPDGRTLEISPDVRIQTRTRQLNSYWTYTLNAGLPSGIWTLEVRIDGAPAGTHSFEVVIPPPSAPAPAPPTPAPSATQTLNELYRLRSSLVWVYKLDGTGRRIDTSSGFVIAQDQIATAFQAVDSARKIEVEFEGGRKAQTDELLAWNRLQDWALLRVATQAAPVLQRGDPAAVAVGEKLAVFNVEQTLHVINNVNITGRSQQPTYGERLLLSPSVPPEAVGGPLLNPTGQVVGVVGGSLTPGSRYSRYDMQVSPGLFSKTGVLNAATPVSLLPASPPAAAAKLASLTGQGGLTEPLAVTPCLLYGGTVPSMPKKWDASTMPSDASEFSRKDKAVWVYTAWQRKDNVGKGLISATVFDAQNQPRVQVAPSKARIPQDMPARHGFQFSPAALEAGTYRIDVMLNGRTVWRTFVTLLD